MFSFGFFVSAASKTAPRTFSQSGSRQSPPEPPTPHKAARSPFTEPARGLDGLRGAATMAQRVKLGGEMTNPDALARAKC